MKNRKAFIVFVAACLALAKGSQLPKYPTCYINITGTRCLFAPYDVKTWREVKNDGTWGDRKLVAEGDKGKIKGADGSFLMGPNLDYDGDKHCIKPGSWGTTTEKPNDVLLPGRYSELLFLGHVNSGKECKELAKKRSIELKVVLQISYNVKTKHCYYSNIQGDKDVPEEGWTHQEVNYTRDLLLPKCSLFGLSDKFFFGPWREREWRSVEHTPMPNAWGPVDERGEWSNYYIREEKDAYFYLFKEDGSKFLTKPIAKRDEWDDSTQCFKSSLVRLTFPTPRNIPYYDSPQQVPARPSLAPQCYLSIFSRSNVFGAFAPWGEKLWRMFDNGSMRTSTGWMNSYIGAEDYKFYLFRKDGSKVYEQPITHPKGGAVWDYLTQCLKPGGSIRTDSKTINVIITSFPLRMGDKGPSPLAADYVKKSKEYNIPTTFLDYKPSKSMSDFQEAINQLKSTYEALMLDFPADDSTVAQGSAQHFSSFPPVGDRKSKPGRITAWKQYYQSPPMVRSLLPKCFLYVLSPSMKFYLSFAPWKNQQWRSKDPENKWSNYYIRKDKSNYFVYQNDGTKLFDEPIGSAWDLDARCLVIASHMTLLNRPLFVYSRDEFSMRIESRLPGTGNLVSTISTPLASLTDIPINSMKIGEGFEIEPQPNSLFQLRSYTNFTPGNSTAKDLVSVWFGPKRPQLDRRSMWVEPFRSKCQLYVVSLDKDKPLLEYYVPWGEQTWRNADAKGKPIDKKDKLTDRSIRVETNKLYIFEGVDKLYDEPIAIITKDKGVSDDIDDVWDGSTNCLRKGSLLLPTKKVFIFSKSIRKLVLSHELYETQSIHQTLTLDEPLYRMQDFIDRAIEAGAAGIAYKDGSKKVDILYPFSPTGRNDPSQLTFKFSNSYSLYSFPHGIAARLGHTWAFSPPPDDTEE